MYLMHLLVVTS